MCISTSLPLSVNSISPSTILALQAVSGVFQGLTSPKCVPRSFNVSKGAAYATANDVRPDAFIRRGADIGIQTREHGETLWNDTAQFLCDAVRLTFSH